MADTAKTHRWFLADGRKPNGDYDARDVLDRLEHEILLRAFSAERNLPLTSSPDDLRVELQILRDAHAEIARLRGGAA